MHYLRGIRNGSRDLPSSLVDEQRRYLSILKQDLRRVSHKLRGLSLEAPVQAGPQGNAIENFVIRALRPSTNLLIKDYFRSLEIIARPELYDDPDGFYEALDALILKFTGLLEHRQREAGILTRLFNRNSFALADQSEAQYVFLQQITRLSSDKQAPARRLFDSGLSEGFLILLADLEAVHPRVSQTVNEEIIFFDEHDESNSSTVAHAHMHIGQAIKSAYFSTARAFQTERLAHDVRRRAVNLVSGLRGEHCVEKLTK
jgi:hypothetical protein